VLASLGAATRSERISQDVEIGLIRVNSLGRPDPGEVLNRLMSFRKSKAGLMPAFAF
jgi:hypothetical protein